jgi:hypothetical protein
MSPELPLSRASHDPGWLQALEARCVAEEVAFPGNEGLAARLASGATATSARGRLAQSILNGWVKGHDDVPVWQWQALSEAIEGWWSALPAESHPLSAGLAPAWVRAQSALGRPQALAQAVDAWAERLGAVEHASLALSLLRHLRRLKGENAVAATLRLVDQLGARWEPGATWTHDLVGSLAMVARQADSLAPLHRVAAWLDRLAPHMGGSDASAWLAPMAASAVRCMALPVLRWLADTLLAIDPPNPDLGQALAGVLGALAEYAPDDRLRAQVERAAQAHPQQPGIQMERARLARADGAGVHELAPALLRLDGAEPATAAAWQLLAEYAFHDGDIELALDCHRRLEALDALDDQSRMRMAHLRLHASTPEDELPMPALQPAAPQRIDPEQAGALTPALAELDAVLAIAPRHDSPVTTAQLEARCATALARFEAELAVLQDLTLADAAVAASHLWELANAGALDLAHWHGVFPFEVGPGLGTLDGHRCRAQCFGVLAHLTALCRHLGRRDRPLLGAPADASLAMWVDLIRQQADAWLAMKRPGQALAELAEVQTRLGPLAAEALAPWRERCLLAAGDIAAVRAQQAAARGAEALPMREWADWLAAEGAAPRVLFEDAAVPGQFEVVDVDGRLRTEHHDAVATELSLVPMADLQVRNIHLLICAQGGILRPHPWHLQMGEFPYAHPNVLNRGAAGAVLRRAAEERRIDEPLVVLANMDAPFHRNYYHWMVLTLTRIHMLLAGGHLRERRLLLPRELTGWMLSSLQDIGLQASQIHWYTAGDDLRLSDAWVASPAEFASPTAVRHLRQCLMQAAGLDAAVDAPGERLIYLARRGETRRPMVEAERAIGLAEELGFEIVAAETLSLLDQVRLFAGARGMAGPPGAAFTNLMWAGRGTRVLTIFKQDINGPTFFDLSFLRGQRHRWLQARSIAGFDGVSIVTSPFSVDLALLRRELAWVRDGDGAVA